MQPGALRALEFDRIVEDVRRFVLTPMGDERIARLAPSVERDQVAHLQAGTTEARRYLAATPLSPRPAAPELVDILAARSVEGRPLEALRLLTLAAFLDSVDE